MAAPVLVAQDSPEVVDLLTSDEEADKVYLVTSDEEADEIDLLALVPQNENDAEADDLVGVENAAAEGVDVLQLVVADADEVAVVNDVAGEAAGEVDLLSLVAGGFEQEDLEVDNGLLC